MIPVIRTTIKPSGINAGYRFDAFGDFDTDISAGWIVRFSQQNDNWNPFTFDAINSFYLSRVQVHARGREIKPFSFNKLLEKEVIVEVDGLYYVTDAFICACYDSSPANKSA